MKNDLPKLVRNKIPEVLEAAGRSYRGHVAASPEFDQRLLDKMLEETEEFRESPSLEELADIYEVFLAILDNWKYSLDEVIGAAKKKRDARGPFSFGVILDEVWD